MALSCILKNPTYLILSIMKQIIIFTLLSLSVASYGQNQKWQLSIQLQPEMTFHKDSYPGLNGSADKTTFNIGVGSSLQYNINERFFVSGGVGFISRTLQTATFLNQAALPPPQQSSTMELVTTKSVSYRVLAFPVNVGYYFLNKDKIKSFVSTGFSGNYLLNTLYTNADFSKYDGSYKNNYWQGYSVNLGLGADYKVTEYILLTSSISYPIVNKVKEDEFIIDKVTLTHNSVTLNLGIKIPF